MNFIHEYHWFRGQKITTEKKDEVHPAVAHVLTRILGVEIAAVDEQGVELTERKRLSIHFDGREINGIQLRVIQSGTAYGFKIIGGLAEGVHRAQFGSRDFSPGDMCIINSLSFKME